MRNFRLLVHSTRCAVRENTARELLNSAKAPMSRGPRGKHAGTASSATRRVTIHDVARLAGVSVGTVSNVLNNPDIVASATRERVLDAIKRTDFVRSEAAHQLRVGKSRTIGVVVLDIANPFFTEMVRGAEHVLREQGYVLMLCSSDESAEREQRYVHVLEEHRVDGLLITPVARDLTSIALLAAHGIPTVLLDREGSEYGLCSVTVDDVLGGELAASHLLQLGHETIAFVNGPITIEQCADRQEGALRAVRKERRRASATLNEIAVPALTEENGEGAVAQFLAAPTRPTAVMCANDLLALGVLRGLAHAGIAVPDDIAVVGYDDIEFASMLSPALTSVRQPKYELGAAAAELLLEETLGSPHEHREVRFEPQLIVRASSTRPSGS